MSLERKSALEVIQENDPNPEQELRLFEKNDLKSIRKVVPGDDVAPEQPSGGSGR